MISQFMIFTVFETYPKSLNCTTFYITYEIELFEDQFVIRRFIFHNKILISSLKYVRNLKS